MSKVGFVGLGIMGTPMAGHLLAGGPRALRLRPAASCRTALVDQGAKVVRVRQGSRASRPTSIIVMVPGHARTSRPRCSTPTASPRDSRKGKIVVDMSSISPVETKAFAERINALGCAYLDAPVSGGEVGRQGGEPHHHGRRSRGRVRDG